MLTVIGSLSQLFSTPLLFSIWQGKPGQGFRAGTFSRSEEILISLTTRTKLKAPFISEVQCFGSPLPRVYLRQNIWYKEFRVYGGGAKQLYFSFHAVAPRSWWKRRECPESVLPLPGILRVARALLQWKCFSSCSIRLFSFWDKHTPQVDKPACLIIRFVIGGCVFLSSHIRSRTSRHCLARFPADSVALKSSL